jgi:hypothetical protein
MKFTALFRPIAGPHALVPALRSAALLSAATLVWASNSVAQGDSSIWMCVDPESGAKMFTNNPRSAKQCHRIDQPAAAARPARPTATTSAAASPKSSASSSTRAAAPALTSEQRQRESDRKQILQDELASENKKLAELQREYNQGTPLRLPGETDENKYRDRKTRLGQDVERSRVNVRSLEQELARL